MININSPYYESYTPLVHIKTTALNFEKHFKRKENEIQIIPLKK